MPLDLEETGPRAQEDFKPIIDSKCPSQSAFANLCRAYGRITGDAAMETIDEWTKRKAEREETAPDREK